MPTSEEAEVQEGPSDQTRVSPVSPGSCADSEGMPHTALSSWWTVAEDACPTLGPGVFIPDNSEKVLGRLDIPADSDGEIDA